MPDCLLSLLSLHRPSVDNTKLQRIPKMAPPPYQPRTPGKSQVPGFATGSPGAYVPGSFPNTPGLQRSMMGGASAPGTAAQGYPGQSGLPGGQQEPPQALFVMKSRQDPTSPFAYKVHLDGNDPKKGLEQALQHVRAEEARARREREQEQMAYESDEGCCCVIA